MLEPGDRVVIVEDAVTRGLSMLEAADRGLPFVALVTAPDLGFSYEGP